MAMTSATDNANDRTCETCVYCSFGGYCDEHGKHLTSVELPACDKYERHPLLVQVEQLKTLCNEMHNCMCEWREESWGFGRGFAERMHELGVPIGRR